MAKATAGKGSSLVRLQWRLEYALVAGFYRMVRRLALPRRLALGRRLGRLAFLVDRRHARVARENLRHAYPDADPLWRARVARESFENLGRLLVEVLVEEDEAQLLPQRFEVEGWENFERVARGGTGYFLLSGHIGNWEWVAVYQGLMGHPLWMITRPLDNPLLERLLATRRECTGNRIVHKRNALRETVKGIRTGKGVAFILDQNFPEAGAHFVPFFGRQAATTPALGTLAVRLKVPIVPIFAHPLPDGRYRLVYEPPLLPPDSGDAAADALTVTAAATSRIEQAVRAAPNAWFWMHRRWRTQPPTRMP
jgi:KDO2-lipid IV(A) lauroyltransferase